MKNLYAVLNHTELLENENDHIMVRITLQGDRKKVTINAMVDSEATEDFIDKAICEKYGIETTRSKVKREIYLADGKPSTMGPVTHTAIVPMEIGSYRESATFQVANLQNHKAILGMPWLRNHNPHVQ